MLLTNLILCLSLHEFRLCILSFKDLMDEMTDVEVWGFVQMVVSDQPELLALLKEHHAKLKRGPEPIPPNRPDRCKCGRCRNMPTRVEQVCCGKRWPHCFSMDLDVRNSCINDRNIITAFRGNREILGNLNRERNMRAMRHTSYRQFVMLKYGHLGKSNRVVIPSCTVWMIRDKYPSPDGHYTGFKPAVGNLAVM